jgi:hypothetical protein
VILSRLTIFQTINCDTKSNRNHFTVQVIKNECHWIKPTNELNLSDEAKEIGLNEKTIVTFGVSLDQLLKNLDAELKQFASTVVLVTDGPNPLRQVLHPHCTRQQIPLPDRFNEFVDLRKCFAKAYPNVGNRPGQSSPSPLAGLMVLPIQTITSLEQMIAGQFLSNGSPH